VVNEALYPSLIIRSIILRKRLSSEHIPRDLMELARRNKVLYLLGLYDERIQQSWEWRELSMRRREQRKAMAEVGMIASEANVDLMIVKTIKPFEYVPDDIDVLMMNEGDVEVLVSMLLRKGYFLRKKGTPEVTLRKVVGDTFVDLDIHHKMGAGHYEYIDKHYLWKRREYVVIDGVKVAKPNVVDEVLITSSHAVMKELVITIADILHVFFLDKAIIEEAMKQSKRIGLATAFGFLSKVASTTISSALRSPEQKLFKYPLYVPPYIVFSAYIENFEYRLKTCRTTPLVELIKTPSSKGIATLLRYAGL